MKKRIFCYTMLLLAISGIINNTKAQQGFGGKIWAGFGSDYNIILKTTFGKHIQPPLFVGISTGLNSPIHSYKKGNKRGNVLAVPMLINVQYTPFRKFFLQPFLDVDLGGENTFASEWNDDIDKIDYQKYKLVGVLSPSIGVKIKILPRFALTFKGSMYLRGDATYYLSKQGYSYALGLEF